MKPVDGGLIGLLQESFQGEAGIIAVSSSGENITFIVEDRSNVTLPILMVEAEAMADGRSIIVEEL